MKQLFYLFLFILLNTNYLLSQTCGNTITSIQNVEFSYPNGILSNLCDDDEMILDFDISSLAGVPNLSNVEFQINIGFGFHNFPQANVYLDDVLISHSIIDFTRPKTSKDMLFNVMIPEYNNSGNPIISHVRIEFDEVLEFAPNNNHFDIFIKHVLSDEQCDSSFNMVQDDLPYFLLDYGIEVLPSNNLASTTIPAPQNPFHGAIYVIDEFIVDVDFEFNSQISFGERFALENNGSVTVLSGVTWLVTDNYHFQACSGNWESITVESGATLIVNDEFNQPCTFTDGNNAIIVEDGGTLIINGAIFNNCGVGIFAQDGATIDIKNCTFNNCGVGLEIDGDPQIINLFSNTFNNCPLGIDAHNSSAQVDLSAINGNERNLFSDCNIGIRVDNAAAKIKYNNFENCSGAIFLNETGFTEILENNIDGGSLGLEATDANFHMHHNLVGLSTPVSLGAFVFRCNDYSFEFNEVDSKRGAIWPWFSSGVIHENQLGEGTQPETSILQFFSSDEIFDNIINADRNGIEAQGVFMDNNIHHNTIDVGGTGCRMEGGSTGIISNNIIDSGADAVLYTASSGNETSCNDLTSGEDCIDVNTGSDTQAIIENYLNGDDNDVEISSVIGIQEHTGNIFEGEHLTAVGLSFLERRASRFIVDGNSPELVPDFPSHPELVDRQPLTATPDNYCSGTPGSPIIGRFLDPTYACAYLNRIETHKNTNPDYYWKSMYRMMRFYLLNIPEANWPPCIKFKWNEDLPCGLKELVIKETDLKKSIKGLENINEAPQNEESQSESTGLNKVVNDQIQYFEEVENVCTEELVQDWNNTYLLILKRMRGDSLTEADKYNLSQVAKKCVSEAGEAVHWARALLTEHEYTDYSSYDNCTQEAEVRSISQSKINTSVIKVFPNPTNNIVDIDFGSSEINIIKIYNAVGQLLDEIKSDKKLYRYNMQDLKEGIYIFEIEDNNQQMTTIKVLKH